MQLRNSPFGEWVLVYYDNKKISEGEIFRMIKSRGCSRAAIMRNQTQKAGQSKFTVLNPYICPGDVLSIQIESDGSEKVSIELPAGWKSIGEVPKSVKGKKVIHLQSSAKTAQGKQIVKFSSGADKGSVNFDVVRIVR